MNENVSVIVAIYNVEKYLKKCVDSILSQTYKNLEVILVDDGSTDESGEICDEYKKQDKRVVVVHQKNQGQSGARNKGIEISKGAFLSFIDGDDEVEENFIFEMVEKIKSRKSSLAVTGMLYRRLQSKVENEVYTKEIRERKQNETKTDYMLTLLAIDGRMYSSVNKLFKSDIIKKYKISFQEKVNFAEDTKFVLDYLAVADGEIRFVNLPLYIYNFGTETSTIKSSGAKWENWQRLYNELRAWAKKETTIKTQGLLALVRARWMVSYIRTKLNLRK